MKTLPAMIKYNKRSLLPCDKATFHHLSKARSKTKQKFSIKMQLHIIFMFYQSSTNVLTIDQEQIDAAA